MSRSSLPPEGRSSRKPETWGSALGFLGGYYGSSGLFDSLAVLENLAVYNPDVSHAIRNWINMANTGHQVVIESGSSRAREIALDELNRLAALLYDGSYGIDGLMNHYFQQIAVSGAISSEDILERNFGGVRQVELVPTGQIRFRYEDDGWRPYQFIRGRYHRLHPVTYRYVSHLRIRTDRPYAKPLIIAAIEPVNRQLRMHENVDYIMKKFGLLGFIDLAVSPPSRKKLETDQEYRERMRKYLSDVAKATSESYRDGVLVHFEDQKFNYNALGAQNQGSYELHKLNEEQVFSGVGIDPAMQGRSYSTTETYAGVVYNLLANECRTLQRMAKRRLEATYRLHLLLRGLDVGVSIQWNEVPERDGKARAEREKIEIENVMMKVRSGLISPDQGAQELGYPKWEDPGIVGSSQLRVNSYKKGKNDTVASYDGEQNEYSHKKSGSFFVPKAVVARAPDQGQVGQDSLGRESVVISGPDRLELSTRYWYDEEEQRLDQLVLDYFRRIRPVVGQAERAAIDAVVSWLKGYDGTLTLEDFVSGASGVVIDGLSGLEGNETLSGVISAACGEIWPKIRQASVAYGEIDERIRRFGELTDRFLMTSYVQNSDYQRGMLRYLRDAYVDYGENLWQRMEPSAIEGFRNQFSGVLEELADYQLKRIMTTTVQTLRNFGEIADLADMGVERLEVFEAMGEMACVICREFHGKVVEVKSALDSVNRLCGMSPKEYLGHLRSKSGMLSQGPGAFRGESMSGLVSAGYGLPPYHPNCKGRVLKHREVTGDVDGNRVNVAEAGKRIDFLDPATQTVKAQTVSYTVLDRWGQKVYVSEEGLKHSKKHGLNSKIPSIIRGADMKVTSNKNGDTMGYADRHGRLVVVKQDGNVVFWTAFKPNYFSRYMKDNFKR